MVKVSVIIPTYNRAKYIRRALESVLAQTYQDYEIIVVDDGSMDNTREILAEFEGKIKYIVQKNQGSAAARNRGIQESKGEYIAFLDSDDIWIPEKLAEQVKILDTHEKIGIVYSRMPIINEKGERLGTKPAGVSGKNFKELLEVWGDLPTSTVMTRKVCFDKAGMFDTALMTMQDIDMWLRIARFYDLYEIEDKMLAHYFRHDGQITKSKIKVCEGRVKIYQKILNTFEDIPTALFIRRIAMHQYTLSKAYYNEKFYFKSFKSIIAAIKCYPFVGILFFGNNDNFLTRVFKFVKPYGFLMVCILRLCFAGLKNFVGGRQDKKL